MFNSSRYLRLCWFVVLFSLLLSACQVEPKNEVVVYVSVDQIYAEPVLKQFEAESGIRVLPVYDVEATKTTGLVNRLLAERKQPQADVYWSGEFAQTIVLKDEGLLEAYQSPDATHLPDQYRDPEGYWTAFAGRARILIVNTDLLTEDHMPDSIFDLMDPAYDPQMVVMAYPLFGTTATHAAALYAQLGQEEARDYYQQLEKRNIRIVDGNSVVRDLVASGEAAFGMTDTDDACRAIEDGAPVKIIFPDQDDLGTMVVPNTAALIKEGPHPEQGKTLIDFLTSNRVEQILVDQGWSQFPLRPVANEPVCGGGPEIRVMTVNLEEAYRSYTVSKEDLTELFLR